MARKFSPLGARVATSVALSRLPYGPRWACATWTAPLAKDGMDRGWTRASVVPKWQHAGSTRHQDALTEEQIWQIIAYVRAGFRAIGSNTRRVTYMPLFLLLLLLLLNTPLHAQGDADVGRELARRWCTACHVVDREGTGTDAGPPLPSLLAGKPSAEEIEGWLADPHPPMSNLDLSRQEINDIMAYLQSLTGQ